MFDKLDSDEARLLGTYRVADRPLYVVGLFDAGVTVYSQQVRALNLAFALIETETIKTRNSPSLRKKVAIIGAGFAGMTLAKALFMKGGDADLTLFERRDALFPLQNGSDTRWLHPRIYDWPAEGSDANAAMLPVMNWVAARASDVVVQVLREWQQEKPPIGTRLFCNTKHLQIHDAAPGKSLQVEWVGESRSVIDGNQASDGLGHSEGSSETFDIVILAVGFGLEKDEALSYWRNDTIGQPSLDRSRTNYVISGQGDGAMIDLLRLRVSQYRQDRILYELFSGSKLLLMKLRELQHKFSGPYSTGLYKAFEEIETGEHKTAFVEAIKRMRHRLRRDTEAVLHLRLRTFADLFDSTNTRISFQNRLLVFVLYKCGGFIPNSSKEDIMLKHLSIDKDDILRRHGTLRDDQLSEMLSEKLFRAIQDRRGKAVPDPFCQSDESKWPGGYFGFPGTVAGSKSLDDIIKQGWRKEYIPGSVSLLATSFCSAVAGFLVFKHPSKKRLRVTLHRAIVFSGEELLQQCCEYLGSPLEQSTRSTGRTFPAKNATIGLAYKTLSCVRTKQGVSKERLAEAMAELQLNAASSAMSSKVGFIMALPLLEPSNQYYGPSPVASILYIDSEAEDFYIDDEETRLLVSMLQHLGSTLTTVKPESFDRLRNTPLTQVCGEAYPATTIPTTVEDVFELTKVQVPVANKPLVLNYDQSDFIPVEVQE